MKLLYCNLMSAMAIVASSFISSATSAQAVPPAYGEYCSANPRYDELCFFCSGGEFFMFDRRWRAITGVNSIAECVNYGWNNGYKFIEAETWYGGGFYCYAPEAGADIDAEGNCSALDHYSNVRRYDGFWKYPPAGIDRWNSGTYIVGNLELWPDGYSCYENGSLKKYTRGCPPGKEQIGPWVGNGDYCTKTWNYGEWLGLDCTSVCCDLETHYNCYPGGGPGTVPPKCVHCPVSPHTGKPYDCSIAICDRAMETQDEDIYAKKHGLDKGMVQKEKAGFLRAMEGSFDK